MLSDFRQRSARPFTLSVISLMLSAILVPPRSPCTLGLPSNFCTTPATSSAERSGGSPFQSDRHPPKWLRSQDRQQPARTSAAGIRLVSLLPTGWGPPA